MLSSLGAGFLADWLGRKKMMIFSGFLFISSVLLIVLSHAFLSLFLGRLLQGLSGGVIAVVVPLYLAECLSAETRGRGSAIFQFMLTFGIVVAALTGFYYTHAAEAAISAAAGNPVLIRAAENHAWRGMFLSVVYPGIIFFTGSFFLSETPRWLFAHGRPTDAYQSLRRSASEDEALLEMKEMEELAQENTKKATGTGSLLQRKYVFPFLLACVILSLNQTTGINSVLAYLAIILKQAGLSASHATQGDLSVKILNCVMTVLGVALIDRKGRKFLLSLGTGGIVVALLLLSFFFHGFEATRVDIQPQVQALVHGNQLVLTPDTVRGWTPASAGPQGLTILYSYGGGDRLASLIGNDTLTIAPEQTPGETPTTAPLHISHAYLAPIPPPRTGWLVSLSLGLFIACYAAGPGVVVWLALSELMPTRIRSAGMGIALLLNQGVGTLFAGIFLPVVSHYGYFAVFLAWAGFVTLYCLTAVFVLPETKGKTLEEIERGFEAA
jgi:MFS family permease